MKKNNYFKNGGPQNNTFKQPKSVEITTNHKSVYIDNVKITTNSEKEDKKLFDSPKSNKRIYSDNDTDTTLVNISGYKKGPSYEIPKDPNDSWFNDRNENNKETDNKN